MENQHQKITGYRDLSQTEIDLMNEIKAAGEKLGTLVEKLEAKYPYSDSELAKVINGVDKRWVAIAKTHLQQGLMALTRSVAQPTTF